MNRAVRRDGVPGRTRADDTRQAARVVQVSAADDVGTICGRIDLAPTAAVVLKVPRSNRALSTELGMRRVSHFAAENGKAVAIATHSGTIATQARKAGLPVSRNPRRVRWENRRRSVPYTAGLLRIPSLRGLLRLTAFAAIAVVIGALILSALPQGTVTVAPPSTQLTRTLAVTASPERDAIDFEDLALPAREVFTTHRLTLAVPTTGTALVGVEPAQMIVAITNPTGTAVSVPEGATLLGGPAYFPFHVAATTEVPAGATVTQLAVASRPGVQGNLAAGTNWGWYEEDLRVLQAVNPEAAGGGTSVERPGVTAADINKALEQARALAGVASLKQRIVDERPHDLVLLGTANVTVDTGEPPAAGTEGDILLLDVNVTVRAYAVLADTLERLALHFLPLEEEGGTLLPGTITASEPQPQPYLGGEALVRTNLVLSADVAEGFTKSDVKKLIRGKSPEVAQALLAERYKAAPLEVTKWPSWAPFLPRFDFRMTINVLPGNGLSSQVQTTQATTTD
jgi:hypothetical protein